MKIKDSFHIYAFITIFFWSLAYVFTRLALQHFSSYSLGLLRYLIASVTLAAAAALMKMKPPKRADLPWFCLAGAAGFFFYMICFNTGSKTVTAATSSVIIATVPVITAVLASIIYKERLKPLQWVSLGVAFLGVTVLTLMNGDFSVNQGMIWLLFASICLSTYNIVQRRLTKTYSALQTTAFSIFTGTIMLCVFFPVSVSEAKDAPMIQWFYVAVLGVFSSAVAYISWAKAFSKAKYTSSVSNYMFVTPFITALLGRVIADERLDAATLCGGSVILLGVLLFNFGDKLMGKVEIRSITFEDIPQCVLVIRQSFATVAEEFQLTEKNCPTNGAFIKEHHLQSALERGAQMYGLFVRNELAGFVQLEKKRTGIFTLEKLAVLPQYRHKGYGETLLMRAKQTALNAGGTSIQIGIIEENVKLKNWYLAHGFIHTGTKEFSHLPFLVGFMELPM